MKFYVKKVISNETLVLNETFLFNETFLTKNIDSWLNLFKNL